MLVKSLVTLLIFLTSHTSFAQLKKALDGHAVYCTQSNNLVQFPKTLKLQVLEQEWQEDVALATIRVSLVQDACEGSQLDNAPNVFDGIMIQSYTLTITDPASGYALLFKHNMEELLKNSAEVITFGIPRTIAKSDVPLEIGVQVFGRLSQNREMFDPFSETFGVFNFKFSPESR